MKPLQEEYKDDPEFKNNHTVSVMPKGWEVKEIDDPQEYGFIIRGPGISYCVWRKDEPAIYLFLEALLSAKRE